MLEPCRPLAQRKLLIGLPEKSGIVEPCSQHAFVSMTNDATRVAIGIQHSQKMWQQLAARIFDCKIFLMIAHDRDQDFLGQLQELAVKTAQNYRRKLGEVNDVIQKSLVFAPTRAGNGASGGVELFANLQLAVAAPQNSRGSQGLNIGRTGL